MSDRPTPLTFDPYPWNQNGPGRSHQPQVMYPFDDGEWIKLDDFRDLERQLAAATEEREQMGKQAHANACEAMSYRRQLTEARTALERCEKHLDGAYSHTVAREECDPIEEAGWILLCELRETLARIDERHPELAGNIAALPPSVGSSDHLTP